MSGTVQYREEWYGISELILLTVTVRCTSLSNLQPEMRYLFYYVDNLLGAVFRNVNSSFLFSEL